MVNLHIYSKMNTTEKGDAFEDRVAAIIQTMLDNGTFAFPTAGSQVLRKKGYYSKDREKEIIFDIALECRRHPDLDPFYYILVECKDTGRPVPVDDVEYFNSTVSQVMGKNVKAMIFSTSNFQEGGLTFARNNGISLIRVMGDDSQKWFVERTSPYLHASPENANSLNLMNALLQPYFISTRHQLFGIDNGNPFTEIKDVLKPILDKEYP